MNDIKHLEALYEGGEIEKLLTLTSTSSDIQHRLFYLRGLRKIGEFEIALSYISDHQMDLYDAFGPTLIELHIDTLFEVGDLDQALNMLKQYEAFPYFSLETNEVIAKLKAEVQRRRKNKQQEHVYDLLALEQALLMGREDLAMSALNYVGKHYSDSYIGLLQKAMLQAPSEMVRSFTLLLLYEKRYDQVVQIKKFAQIKKVVPSKITDPLKTRNFMKMDETLKALAERDNDSNIKTVLENVFIHHFIHLFPQTVTLKDVDLVAKLYEFTALNMMGRNISFPNFLIEESLDEHMMAQLITKYEFLHFSYFATHYGQST